MIQQSDKGGVYRENSFAVVCMEDVCYEVTSIRLHYFWLQKSEGKLILRQEMCKVFIHLKKTTTIYVYIVAFLVVCSFLMTVFVYFLHILVKNSLLVQEDHKKTADNYF